MELSILRENLNGLKTASGLGASCARKPASIEGGIPGVLVSDGVFVMVGVKLMVGVRLIVGVKVIVGLGTRVAVGGK